MASTGVLTDQKRDEWALFRQRASSMLRAAKSTTASGWLAGWLASCRRTTIIHATLGAFMRVLHAKVAKFAWPNQRQTVARRLFE